MAVKNELLNALDERLRDIIGQHPADIAEMLLELPEKQQVSLLSKLPLTLSVSVFEELPDAVQAKLLIQLDMERVANLLRNIRIDDIVNLFDHLSDEETKKYLRLMQKKQRSRIISQLSFASESAGRIMDTEVLSLTEDMTIEQSIRLLHHLDPEDIHHQIYVTDAAGKLVGHINLEQLILTKPKVLLKDVLQRNELVFSATEDREHISNEMQHYGLHSAPVIDETKSFLGIITAGDVFEIIADEAEEDVYKISGIPGIEKDYFQTPFWSLIIARSPWLVVLLLLQAVSSSIMGHYDGLLQQHTIIAFFLTMLIGTGGNAGNQSGALVIRGLATGEMGRHNSLQVLFREFRISLIMASLLAVIGFARVYVTYGDLASALAINISLGLIVITSMMLGTFLPLMLSRLNFDPAHSAAPFLATLTDIIGIFIYFLIAGYFLA